MFYEPKTTEEWRERVMELELELQETKAELRALKSGPNAKIKKDPNRLDVIDTYPPIEYLSIRSDYYRDLLDAFEALEETLKKGSK